MSQSAQRGKSDPLSVGGLTRNIHAAGPGEGREPGRIFFRFAVIGSSGRDHMVLGTRLRGISSATWSAARRVLGPYDCTKNSRGEQRAGLSAAHSPRRHDSEGGVRFVLAGLHHTGTSWALGDQVGRRSSGPGKNSESTARVLPRAVTQRVPAGPNRRAAHLPRQVAGETHGPRRASEEAAGRCDFNHSPKRGALRLEPLRASGGVRLGSRGGSAPAVRPATLHAGQSTRAGERRSVKPMGVDDSGHVGASRRRTLVQGASVGCGAPTYSLSFGTATRAHRGVYTPSLDRRSRELVRMHGQG